MIKQMAHQNLPYPVGSLRQLCLLRLSAVGDCCNLVPVIRTLQKYLPNTELTWVIGKNEATLFRDLDGVELIEYDKAKGTGMLKQQLSAHQFDAVLLMQVALRAGLLSRQVAAPMRLGFDRARSRDGHGLFINHRISPAAPGHVIDGFFGFCQFFGINHRAMRWGIPIPNSTTVRLESLIPSKQPFLVISPCSSQRSRNYRNWSMENYAAVAVHAAQRRGLHVVITGTGTEEEHAYAAYIQRSVMETKSEMAMTVPVTNLVGKTDLKLLFALLHRATAVIAPDSGPVHMSVAAGTPAIGLYATSNPDRTGPVLGKRWVVNQYPEAVRRFLGKDISATRWGRRVRHPDAMSLITASMVIERLEGLLATPEDERLERISQTSEGQNFD